MASRLWSPGLLIGAGARLHVEGAERIGWSRLHVIVANHQSMIDICAMFRAAPVPLRFVIKEELCEPIETSSAEPDRQAVAHRAHEAVERLLSETNG